MKPLYHLEEVRQVYQGRQVLHVPALSLQEGEILALIGPSGAGKSTLLRLLALLEAPVAGRVAYAAQDGQWVTAHSASTLQRRELAMVFQRPSLVTASVARNVSLALALQGRYDARCVAEVLERVHLSKLAQAKPHTLSGGELQRVALARALVLEPRVLILDEPTASLDPYNVGLIESLLRDYHAQQRSTLILVTHNIFQARRLATRTGFILDGEWIEDGPTERFFEAPCDARTAAFLRGDLIC